MPKFEIDYKKIIYCSCIVDAQNEGQVRYLYENDMLDLGDEHHGNSGLGDIISIKKVK